MAVTRRTRRIIGAGAAAVLLVGVTGVVAYRVFAPAETLTAAAAADYPVAPADSTGVSGTLPTAPLIVAGRLRISAAIREVSADGPIDAKYRNTPYWAYRRWPAELTGVLIVGTAPAGNQSAGPTASASTGPSKGPGAGSGVAPLVVTHWSDGELVALDARTGGVAWRVTGPATDARYDGRRTGARTVYDPPGLRLGRVPGGPTVLTVAGRTELVGLDAGSGRRLWQVDVPAACRAGELATTGGGLVAVDTCDTPRMVEFRTVVDGSLVRRWRPDTGGERLELAGLGCAVGGSDCPALRVTDGTGAGHGWRTDRPEPAPAATLDPAGSTAVDGFAVTAGDTLVSARPVAGGPDRWRHTVASGTTILAVEPGRVHLLTADRQLLTLDAGTGRELSRFELRYAEDGTGWDPGAAYASDGFVAVERLARPVEPSAGDQRYYLAARPVILAATG